MKYIKSTLEIYIWKYEFAKSKQNELSQKPMFGTQLQMPL